MSRTVQTLTPAQSAIFQRGRESYATLRRAQADIDRKVAAYREEQEREVEAIRVRWTQDAFAISEAGVSIALIAREIMGQTSRNAARDAIKEGERYVVPTGAGEAFISSAFERVDGGIVFRPRPDDLAQILEKLDLEADAVPSDASATFSVRDGIIAPVTPAILPGGGMNPIVAMVMADGSPHGRALIEFAEASV